MKVVGGPHDGREVPVPDRAPYIRLFEMQDLPPLVGPPSEIPVVGPTIKEHFYTIRRFCFGRDDYYEFLAPYEWSDKQAFLHQFSK